MEHTINKLENCHVEISVKVDKETWKNAQKKAFDKLAKNVTIDGFRKGKAPASLVKSRINPSELLNEAINIALPEAYQSVLNEERLEVYSQPKVEIEKYNDDELEVKFNVITAPDVELGQYTGFEIGLDKVEVTEEDIDKAIKDLQAQNANLVLKEGEAALGDTVVIDFKGYIDGQPFEGGDAENYDLELGSNSFIPGFEEQLVGHKAEDEFDLPVKFPDNYIEELKGKEAIFKIKVHEVKEKQIPELDDELVKDLGIENVETIASLREHEKEELTKKKEGEAKNKYFNTLLAKIVEGSKIVAPNEIYENEALSDYQNTVNRI